MGLGKTEFDEMLSRFFEESHVVDPEVSIVPDGTRFPLLDQELDVEGSDLSNTDNTMVGSGDSLAKPGASKDTLTKIPAVPPSPKPSKPVGTHHRLPTWRVASDTNPIDRRGQNLSSTLIQTHMVNFSLQNRLGEGGFGEVWEALQVSMGRRIAVKRLREFGADGKKEKMSEESFELLKSDFRREALTTALLEHPNIVPVHDLGEDEQGRPLMAMKLVRGKSWDELIREDYLKPIPEYLPRHLRILMDVSQAVAFAHSKGVVHRDLKPSQVMVGEFGEVLLMDWGIAMIYDNTLVHQELQDLGWEFAPTKANAVNPAGTPAYMAPEQTKRNALEVGPWTDTYLLGGILYFLLTRKAPHSCGNAQEAFKHASKGEVTPPSQVAPSRGITQELDALVMKALHPVRQQRFQTAREFIAALERYLSGESTKAESQQIVGVVKAKLAEDKEGYDILYECQNQLFRALSLWPGNHEAEALQIQITETMATRALENNDLVLCRLLLKNMQTGERHTSLMHDLDAKERQNRRDAKRRVVLNVVITIFVVVIIVDLILLFSFYVK